MQDEEFEKILYLLKQRYPEEFQQEDQEQYQDPSLLSTLGQLGLGVGSFALANAAMGPLSRFASPFLKSGLRKGLDLATGASKRNALAPAKRTKGLLRKLNPFRKKRSSSLLKGKNKSTTSQKSRRLRKRLSPNPYRATFNIGLRSPQFTHLNDRPNIL